MHHRRHHRHHRYRHHLHSRRLRCSHLIRSHATPLAGAEPAFRQSPLVVCNPKPRFLHFPGDVLPARTIEIKGAVMSDAETNPHAAGAVASHVTRHTSHVTRHTSHVTRHTSHVTRYTSHFTRHTSHLTPQAIKCTSISMSLTSRVEEVPPLLFCINM